MSSPPPDCFSGVAEATYWQQYWPFLVCMEKHYEQSIGVEPAAACAEESGLEFVHLMSCYDKYDLLEAVCAAYSGPEPPACEGVQFGA